MPIKLRLGSDRLGFEEVGFVNLGGLELGDVGVQEDGGVDEAHLLEAELEGGFEDSEAVDAGAAEVDGGGLFEVLGGAGDFADAEAEVSGLGEHLVVEDEVVGEVEEGKALEDGAAPATVAGVVLGDFLREQDVFSQGEEAVGEVFVDGHAADEGSLAKDAGIEHVVELVVGDHGGHGGDEARSVLVVGVEHDDDVGSTGEGDGVAGFLVAAVATVFLVLDGDESEFAGESGGVVLAGVVGEDDVVDDFVGHFVEGLPEGFGGVVGRHYDGDSFSIQHAGLSRIEGSQDDVTGLTRRWLERKRYNKRVRRAKVTGLKNLPRGLKPLANWR